MFDRTSGLMAQSVYSYYISQSPSSSNFMNGDEVFVWLRFYPSPSSLPFTEPAGKPSFEQCHIVSKVLATFCWCWCILMIICNPCCRSDKDTGRATILDASPLHGSSDTGHSGRCLVQYHSDGTTFWARVGRIHRVITTYPAVIMTGTTLEYRRLARSQVVCPEISLSTQTVLRAEKLSEGLIAAQAKTGIKICNAHGCR
jgi:hypothetical protein